MICYDSGPDSIIDLHGCCSESSEPSPIPSPTIFSGPYIAEPSPDIAVVYARPAPELFPAPRGVLCDQQNKKRYANDHD